MNKTLGKGLALILGMGIMAGCEYQENTAKPMQNAPEIIEIAANECKDLCGGKICYEDVRTDESVTRLAGYTIAFEGFKNYSRIAERFMLVNECIFYKVSNDTKRLTLEKLR